MSSVLVTKKSREVQPDALPCEEKATVECESASPSPKRLDGLPDVQGDDEPWPSSAGVRVSSRSSAEGGRLREAHAGESQRLRLNLHAELRCAHLSTSGSQRKYLVLVGAEHSGNIWVS